MSKTSTTTLPGPIRRFKPYPAYKNSGVEWLGEIPAHWEVKRLKFAAHIEAGQSPPSELVSDGSDGLPFLQGNADFGPVSPMPRQVCDMAPKRAQPGDILLSVRAPVGAMNVADQRYGIGRGLCAIRPTAEGDSRFSFYTLATTRTLLDSVATGSTYDAVTTAQVGDLPAFLPKLPEQRAIAAFLDRETGRIDALVAKKERLIELLQEERTALITRAITKGLDPNVPMKDSGVEWLGEIPAHWEVTPLKHVANFINGLAFKPDEWVPEGTPIIRIENLNGGEDFNCTIRELPSKYVADKGDLLFGWSGNRGTSFGPFLWWRAGKHYVNQHIFLVVDFNVDKAWLYWTLRGVTSYVEKQAHGIIGMVHITRGELGIIPIPVPPPNEQVEIARFLEKEHKRIDSIAERVREAINRLKELRTVLISAAVTGKIDVREEVV